jgi:hypothetical protein
MMHIKGASFQTKNTTPTNMPTLREELASGRIQTKEDLAKGANIQPTVGGLSTTTVINPPPPKIQDAAMRAHLDAKYGNVSGVVVPPELACKIGDPFGTLPPTGDPIMPNIVQVGQPTAYLTEIKGTFPHTKIAGIQIEDSVPIPDPAAQIQMVCEVLKVGQSFLIKEVLKKSQILYVFKKLCKGNDKKFTCACNDMGWRIWRVS